MKRAAAASLIALLAYCGVLALLMRKHGGDISLMVVAGGGGVDATKTPRGLTVDPNSGGYDGMMFYRLALDPFTRVQTAYGVTLDAPAYRQQRILYPLIVWMLSLGNAEWVPSLLVVVNLIAIAVMAFAAAAIARQYGLDPLWGALVPLFPGFLITFSRDTSEIVACAFAVCAIWAYGASRWATCTVLFCCAVLTRETWLLVPVAIGIVWLRRRAVPPYVFIAPGALYVLWQAILGARWDVTPLAAGAPDRILPFAGYFGVLADSSARRSVLDRLHFAECIFLALLVLIVLVIWRRSAARAEWRFAWLGYLALAAMLGRDIWTEHFGFMRVLGDFSAMTLLIILGANRTARWSTCAIVVSLWLYVARHI
ncbi:MAG TPA: hypothetical protein VF911_11045 [Thermoanaerobaculia bacterium]